MRTVNADEGVVAVLGPRYLREDIVSDREVRGGDSQLSKAV